MIISAVTIITLAIRPPPTCHISICVILSAVASPILSFLLQAQKPEQSVMQALESLNDSQVRPCTPHNSDFFHCIEGSEFRFNS